MKFSRVAAGGLLGLVLAGSSATGAMAAPAHSDQVAPTTQAGHISASSGGTVQPRASRPRPRCLIWIKTGGHHTGWTAGYSWTWKTVVSRGARGNTVKEIQCLLDFHGYSPGHLDGIYGSQTADAVRRFQKRRCTASAPDGVVGKATWYCLRAHQR